MLRDTNTHYDRLAKALRESCGQGKKAREDAISRIDAELRANRPSDGRIMLLACGGRPFRSESTGAIMNLLVGILMPTLSKACDFEDEARMTHEVEVLAVALACFHAESGRWPAELKELSPSLLKTIPIDRFSAKPLVYKPSKKGYLLYSVGKNMRDDGGLCNTPGQVAGEKTDDIAAEVPPADTTSKPADATPAEAASKPAASQP